jgi:hypothetical protein
MNLIINLHITKLLFVVSKVGKCCPWPESQTNNLEWQSVLITSNITLGLATVLHGPLGLEHDGHDQLGVGVDAAADGFN